MKFYYFISNYISHKKVGVNNIRCLLKAGFKQVSHPQQAEIIVIHDEAPSIPLYYQHAPILKNKYVIVFSLWETTNLPKIYQENLKGVDEIWTSSQWTASIYQKYHPKVSVFPFLIESPLPNSARGNEIASMLKTRPNDFYFYTISKAGDPRKNIWTLISSFQRLLPTLHDRTFLIIKQYALTIPQLSNLPNVISLTDNWKEDQILDLHEMGDCYLSTHHGEGWGLGISEAMAMNNPVIATGATGNMEYMTQENSFPIPAKKRHLYPWEVQFQPQLLDTDMCWYDVDPMAFMDTMSKVYFNKNNLSITPNEVLKRFSMNSLIQKFQTWRERFPQTI